MDYKEIMPNRHIYHIPSSKLASLDCEDCRASYGPNPDAEAGSEELPGAK